MKLTPARRVTLALGVPVSLALIGWTSFNFVALAGTGTEQVNHSFAVHDNALRMHIPAGSVTLVPEQGSTTARLTGKITYSLIKPSVSYDQGGVNFDCPVPAGICDFSSTLAFPPAAAVNLSSGAGDMTVNDGISGDLTLDTSAGDISASGIESSDVRVHSDVGDISLQFTKVPTSVDVFSAAGDISIELPGSATYKVSSHFGVGSSSVNVPQSSSSPHVINVTTDVGDISVTTS